MDTLKINAATVRKKLVKFLRQEFKKRGFRRAVLGISGGIDSAVVATLASEALGAKNVLGLFMPYSYSKKDLKDAEALVGKLGIRFKIVDIAPMVDSYFDRFPEADKIRRGNMMARERMAVLYDHSKQFNALVLGCGNKTEVLVGYFTLHGDSACAVNPVGSLYKTQVRQLAKALGIPASIIGKSPSASLWPGQTDERELGIAYDELDKILYYLVDKKSKASKLIKLGFSGRSVDRVSAYLKKSRFKRLPPAIAGL